MNVSVTELIPMLEICATLLGGLSFFYFRLAARIENKIDKNIERIDKNMERMDTKFTQAMQSMDTKFTQAMQSMDTKFTQAMQESDKHWRELFIYMNTRIDISKENKKPELKIDA